MHPLQGQVQGRVDGQVDGGLEGGQGQAPRLQSAPPAPPFVENPTDEIPRIADPTGSNGVNGHRAASAPTDGRPAAPRRARIAHDPGPATGAMSPEDLLGGDDDEAQDDVKILGRSVTDLEAKPTANGSDANGDTADPERDDAPGPVSRMSRRSTKPKRRFRLRGKSKADAEETVLTTARPPSTSTSTSAPTSTPAGADVDVDVDQDEDAFTPGPPAVGGDWGARQAPIGGFAPAGADAPARTDVPAGLTDKAEVAPEATAEPRSNRTAATADSPAKAWLVIIAQLVGGAVAGAALWVAFRYLWGNLPPVALGAAVLATAGSVLLVRAIRRRDDLRTSLFAVLVGLVVTVSPAVLVLVSR